MEMNWSRWFRCESSFGLLLVPNQPGIFALAEEVVQPGAHSRRMLAVFEIEEADDLARGLSRLFATGSPWREKLAERRCYIRYAIAPSIADRQAAVIALKSWLQSRREMASQVFENQVFEKQVFENQSFEKNVRVPSEFALAMAPAQVLAKPDSPNDDSGAGEIRSDRRIARAQHEGGVSNKPDVGLMGWEGGAAQRCGALEENELKTMAERAVDRVTHGMKLAKASTAGL